MKEKISISLEEKTIEQIQQLRRDVRFRNKSHVIEFAVKDMISKDNA